MPLSDYIEYKVDRMVRKYEDNKASLESLTEQYAEICQKDIGSIDYSKDRVQTSPTPDGTINLIIHKESIKEELDFLTWFVPLFEKAWDRLTEDEQFVLDEFYGKCYERKQEAVDSVCDRYSCEKTAAYEILDDAKKRLKRLMFG